MRGLLFKLQAINDFAFDGMALFSGTDGFPLMRVERQLSCKLGMDFLEAMAWIHGMASEEFAVQNASKGRVCL